MSSQLDAETAKIRTVRGDLFSRDVEAIVNPVNCVGTMGKGLAAQFKARFPENYEAYLEACARGEIVPGKVFVCRLNKKSNPKFVINFPTKRHWRDGSLLSYVSSGLSDLVAKLAFYEIRSVAIPALGCGLGGLDWKDVRPLIERELDRVRGLEEAFIFEPRE